MWCIRNRINKVILGLQKIHSKLNFKKKEASAVGFNKFQKTFEIKVRHFYTVMICIISTSHGRGEIKLEQAHNAR